MILKNLYQNYMSIAICAVVSFSVNLELFTARQAMATPPVVVHPRESVSRLARLLIDTAHGGYPMVPAVGSTQEENKFLGIITR